MSDLLGTEDLDANRRFDAARPSSSGGAGNGSTTGTGAGAMLRLIRDGRASTRAELVALTGLARSTVAQRMDALLAQRLVVPAGGSVSTGGRPPQMFAFNRDAGVVLSADLGATHSRLPGTDLGGEGLLQGAEEI